mmetsp:Transcript_27603/g.40728  ORF Transcript_27603/g.40728 Transcript_27603/m.40728 type:complete len:148 (+) Transcript_27603:422-865(+)
MMKERKNNINGPPSNKDSRSFRPSSLAEINAMNKYQPLVIKYTKRDGSPGECPLGCGLSVEDIIIIFTLYCTFYSFLIGTVSLLLRAAVDTSESSTILWAFLFVGIMFSVLVVASVKMGTMENKRKRESKREEIDLLKKNRDAEDNL